MKQSFGQSKALKVTHSMRRKVRILYFGKRERARLGIVPYNYDLKTNLNEEQKRLRRPDRVLINGLMTILLIMTHKSGKVAAPVLFTVAGLLALWINYPKLVTSRKF